MCVGILAALAASFIASGAMAAKKPAGAWQVIRQPDPVTGRSTCTVAAIDAAGGSAFSRTGALYPVVENNPVHGLLVGVSSGGRFRLPAGDILWRVDDRPFRELRAADNPAPAGTTPVAPVPPGPNDAATKAMQEAMASTMRLTAGMTATSTMASGPRARDMLAELLAGHQLLYRSASAAPDFGLPSSEALRVGQYTAKGQRPIPIDDSFRVGVTSCGIAP